MKPLPPIRPTAEQIALSVANRFGVDLIRGAAGTGKTTTALLKLRSMYHLVEQQRNADADERPIKILVLTFNRTLCGYIDAYIAQSLQDRFRASLNLSTFGNWAYHYLGGPEVIQKEDEAGLLMALAGGLPLEASFVMEEVDYLLGRFLPEDIASYLTIERTGRGTEPRLERPLRERLLNEVVTPYRESLRAKGLHSWNDIAVAMARTDSSESYDIVVIDEAQDFSANQLRAVFRHTAQPLHCVTFVMDTVQRIYARGFTWKETGFNVSPARAHRLIENHRNTKEIASFAAGILKGVAVDDDGAIPNLQRASRTGSLPIVLKGLYSDQVRWALRFIASEVDLERETVGFLSPLGGGYFSYLEQALDNNGIAYDDITRNREWPVSSANIALSTFHSAKGLEFDYVIILGLSSQNTGHGEPERDDKLTVLRRLFAMAICRARKGIIVGYKEGEESDLVAFFESGTFTEVSV